MTKKDFYLHALEVVYSFYEYDSYAKSRRKAVRALNRRCPGFTYEQCERSFNALLDLYEKAVKFVEKNADLYAYRYRNKIKKYVYSNEELAFFNDHKSLPRFVIVSMINMIFYWRHLR